jgi:hypothetical protein
MARLLDKAIQRVNPAAAVRQTGKGAPSKGASSQSSKPTRSGPIDADRRRTMIAEAAYYRSLRLGGTEIENWLAAEQEVDTQVMSPGSQ